MSSQADRENDKVMNLFDGSTTQDLGGGESGSGDKATALPVPLPTPPTTQGAKLRRSTFQLRESTVNDLDRFHLELQLALGKQNAPYKEVLVEAAIVHFLNSTRANPSEWLDVLLAWQQVRRRSR